MIADDTSFASSESQALPVLSTTLQEVLKINNDTTDDNDSVVSSPKEYGIRPTDQALITDPRATIAVASYPLLSSSLETTSQPNIQVPAPLRAAGPPVICPDRDISEEC